MDTGGDMMNNKGPLNIFTNLGLLLIIGWCHWGRSAPICF
jgi:hypothetical protein